VPAIPDHPKELLLPTAGVNHGQTTISGMPALFGLMTEGGLSKSIFTYYPQFGHACVYLIQYTVSNLTYSPQTLAALILNFIFCRILFLK
jgi:hypothetical protein